jgi:hypothetical protein
MVFLKRKGESPLAQGSREAVTEAGRSIPLASPVQGEVPNEVRRRGCYLVDTRKTKQAGSRSYPLVNQ